jgi:hypothetical protein
MTEGASKLLRELALLLRRHPPEEFEELARLLERPEFTSSLGRLLAELASAGKQATLRRRAPGRADILDAMRSEDQAKFALLQAAQENLLDKRIHESLADLVRAVESSGVPIPKKSYRRREDVVLAFFHSAKGMPTDELARALARLGVAKTDSDLRSWSHIIVPKKDVSGRK